AIARLSLPPRRNVHKSAIRVPERELDRAGTQPKQASAHYVGGHTTKTFAEGIFSCFGHSIIALDHFAAVVAMGCLAAVHGSGRPSGSSCVTASRAIGRNPNHFAMSAAAHEACYFPGSPSARHLGVPAKCLSMDQGADAVVGQQFKQNGMRHLAVQYDDA